jgi:predicted transcriptional regulator of viral defense system
MNFYQFKEGVYDLGVFSNRQVQGIYPGFDRNNLGRWTDKGYLLKLRNGYYSFPDYLKTPGFYMYVANQIYSPSYISLQQALEFYGLIPESVFNSTSVTTLHSYHFKNRFGGFYYQQVSEDLYFGYKQLAFNDRVVMIATLEKAILDFFYLNTFYETEKDMKELRFNETVLENDLNLSALFLYLKKFKNKKLEYRVQKMINSYNLK